MKLAVVSLFCIVVLSCKEAPKEIKSEVIAPEMLTEVNDSKYPEALQKVFDAHGGLTAWKSKRMISFEIPKAHKTEKHSIDLYTRDEKIEMPGVTMGSRGSDIWLLDEEEVYKGDAVFYHNLMFYFYTMPFVLSDEGINYGDAEALKFEGTIYPGIRISYGEGVGLSSKDEYFIHYNSETYQMEWLGYTVTFKSGEQSDDIRWIHYNDWMNVDGLVLPNSLTWHAYEGRTIKEARDPVNFENVILSEKALPADFFTPPEGAKIVKAKIE